MDADLICPVCLDEYELLEFEVDPDTLEHRGIFRCSCGEIYIFPECLTRHMIDDEDTRERLRISRILHLGKSLDEMKRRERSASARSVLRVNNRHLDRYLADVSEKSLRALSRRSQ